MSRWERLEHAALLSIFGYETTAIFSRGRIPTLTRLNRRWPVLGCALEVALAWHFAAAVEVATDASMDRPDRLG